MDAAATYLTVIGTLLNNRYRIDSQLGEGGMGVVYKAHDTLLDRPVAIKTLSPHLLGEEGLKRLLREAQSAAKLTHPNIVGIHDVIDEGATRLIVMEYVEGHTLRDILPVQWGKVVEIVVQVCSALDYAHQRGVVHRDIKPENIVITADGTAKVMDFGLARSEGRSRLTQTGMLVGTVAYMAPEQALQGVADARSDLYSLGCVAYELITGHPPFEADDPIAVITQHINIPPVAPRFHTTNIPPALDTAIIKLLAKDPQTRFRSAEALRTTLEQFRGSAVATPSEVQTGLAGVELVQAVRPGALVGRDQELHTLRALLDEAASGEGRLVLITGQAGVGKTRLVEELITYAHLRGVRVLSSRCYEGGTPYEPLIRMLREYLRSASTEEIRAALGDYASDLVRLVPEIRQKLGTLPESIPLPPDQERARLFEAVTRLLALAHSTPLLLFIDDLHLGDPATLQLLRYLTPAIAAERVLLVTASRSEETNRSPAFAELLKQLRRERHAKPIDVKPLTQDQVGELIQAMAKHPTRPVRFAARIFEVTEGNPYFIEEVINALFEQGTLYLKDGQWTTDFDEGGRYAEMPVAATIRTTIETRLQQLSESCRHILSQAAVLGRQFRIDILATLAEKTEDALVDLLEEAVGAKLLREVRIGGEDRFEFTQSMVREVIYDGIIRHRRRRIHLRAAEALERIFEGKSERAGEIADHFFEAGEEQRAVPYLITAGEYAQTLFAHDEAIRRFEAATELLKDAGNTEEMLRLLERLGEPYLHSGHPQKAIECYQRVLGHYEAQKARPKVAELLRKIGHAYQITWDFAAAIPILERALHESGPEANHLALMLYLDLARVHNFSGGDPGSRMALASKALELAGALGATDEAAVAHVEMGVAYLWSMQFREGEEHLREATRLTQHSNSYLGKYTLRRSVNNLGATERLRGNYQGDLDARRKALEMVEEVRDLSGMAFAIINVGVSLWRLGDWRAAGSYFQRAMVLGSGGMPRGSIYVRFLDEDWEGALQHLDTDAREAERRRDAQAAYADYMHMAEAALRLEQYTVAEQYARRGVELQFPAPSWNWPELLNLFSESLARQGDVDEATTVCDQCEATATAIGGTGIFGGIHHVRGLIAMSRGQAEAAATHLNESIRVYDEFPYPYAQAHVFEDLARLHESSDRGQALDAYTKALAIYDRLGAKRSVTRVQKRIAGLQPAVT